MMTDLLFDLAGDAKRRGIVLDFGFVSDVPELLRPAYESCMRHGRFDAGFFLVSREGNVNLYGNDDAFEVLSRVCRSALYTTPVTQLDPDTRLRLWALRNLPPTLFGPADVGYTPSEIWDLRHTAWTQSSVPTRRMAKKKSYNELMSAMGAT